MRERKVTRSYDWLRTGPHPATRWTEGVLVNQLCKLVDKKEPTTSTYLKEHYSAFNSALDNHGRRRIFGLAGVYLPERPGQRKLAQDNDGNR